MKKLFPVFIIFVIVFIFFYQLFLYRFFPIPSDDLVGLYHPFRDVFVKEFPHGIPFKNFLITDPIRQQYPWRELTISLEKQLQLPLWNPYSFSGYPLLANFQSGVFYPLNLFFFFLPFPVSWSLLITVQPLFAGVFLYLYLRNLKIHPFAALIGSVAFAFSGSSIAWLAWGTIMQTLLWLPLILLAKDKLLQRWTIRWTIIFLFAEIASILAGHIQIWFYTICVSNAYLFLRIYQKTKLQKAKNFLLQYQKIYFPFLLVGITMFVITSFQWLPTLQLIFLSARSIDQNYLATAGWFLPYQHLLQFIAPDFFGNPTTLNYWGVWNYGEFIGYIGILPLVFALFAVFARHDKKTYFWGILCLSSLLFALPTPLAKLPYILHAPFLSTSQPTRLMGIIDLSLAVLAALGLDYFLKNKSRKMIWALGFIGIVFITLWLVIVKFYVLFDISLVNAQIAKQNLVLPSILFLLSSCIILFWIFIKNKKVSVLIYCIVLLVIGFDLLRFGWKFTPLTPQKYLYPQTQAITFLQKNIGNYRFMTTDSQILPPNVSDVYRLQSIEGYDPLYLENYGQFIAAVQRNKPDISSPFGFNRIITPHEFDSPFINLLGVKYVLSLDNLQKGGLKKVFQEGETQVYENTNVLPRAFFVSQVIDVNSKQDEIDKMFSYKDTLGSIAIVSSGNPVAHFTTIHSNVLVYHYSENSVELQTNNSSDGFLVLTDIYYPTWHAYIDRNETKIYQTDFAFRGIVVPSGKHSIVFADQLF